MRHHLDVDADGNLYVADVYNNRVLVYFAPFSADRTGGKGDTVADLVIGQADFTSNGVNRGRGRASPTPVRSTSASAASTTSPPAASRWMPRETSGWRTRSTTGCCGSPRARPRPTSCSASPTSRPRRPSPNLKQGHARTHVYADHRPRQSREPANCTSSMSIPAASPAASWSSSRRSRTAWPADRVLVAKQRLEGDYKDGYRLTHATAPGLQSGQDRRLDRPDKKTHRYRDGVVCGCATQHRCMLLDKRRARSCWRSAHRTR